MRLRVRECCAAEAVVNVHTNQVVRVIGKSENTTRFMNLSLFQGAPKTKAVLTLVRCLQWVPGGERGTHHSAVQGRATGVSVRGRVGGWP